jgi:hypothetical protein
VRRKAESETELEGLIAVWRRSSPTQESLRPATRARILSAARDGAPQTRRSESLFLPLPRLALAAAAPTLVLTLAVAFLLLPQGGGDPVERPRAELLASKQGNDVVFVIANGGTTYQVYKSSQVNQLGTWEPYTKTEGTFRDRLDSGADLVFYKID